MQRGCWLGRIPKARHFRVIHRCCQATWKPKDFSEFPPSISLKCADSLLWRWAFFTLVLVKLKAEVVPFQRLKQHYWPNFIKEGSLFESEMMYTFVHTSVYSIAKKWQNSSLLCVKKWPLLRDLLWKVLFEGVCIVTRTGEN